MNEKLMQAMEAQKNAQSALDVANEIVRKAAVEHYCEALDALRAAGVALPTVKLKKRGTPEHRARMAQIARDRWASKTPEERAAWVQKINRARPQSEAVN